MTAFNYENLSANLPYAFKKDRVSNNYKLLEVEKHIYSKIEEMFKSVYSILDLSNAYGKTLDMYGERVCLERGNATDEQYRIRIKSKIAQNLCDGSRESIAAALAYILQCNTNRIQIVTGDSTGKVEMIGIPLENLYTAGFNTDEITDLINSLFITNVRLDVVNYLGTFEFSASSDEYDEYKGFADETGTIGGFFGLIDFEE